MLSLSQWVQAAWGLLCTEVCPGCSLDVPAGRRFCPACEPLLERVSAQRRPPAARAAAFVYGGPAADAMLALKYAGRAEFARPLGELLAMECLGYAGRIDRVLPVPLHPTRVRERGFNQSALLAAVVAERLSVPLDTRSLRRLRVTRDQAGLARRERRANVEGAFTCRTAPPAVTRALLIDDVETTGATLAAASAALLDAGFSNVYTLAFASSELDP